MSHGGSYADNAVTERRDMGMFFLVILCLTPVSFATTLPVVSRLKLKILKIMRYDIPFIQVLSLDM